MPRGIVSRLLEENWIARWIILLEVDGERGGEKVEIIPVNESENIRRKLEADNSFVCQRSRSYSTILFFAERAFSDYHDKSHWPKCARVNSAKVQREIIKFQESFTSDR